jgi:hypothetical protein
LGRIDKLLNKALSSPKNLRFREFRTLIESYGAELRNTKGSHQIYKRAEEPSFTMSIQDVGGMAKPYQVKQFIDKLLELGLLEAEEE